MGQLVTDAVVRLRFVVKGRVQGVGFRPVVYRVAEGLELGGWVRNSSQGAQIEVEGRRVGHFQEALLGSLPEQAEVDSLECQEISPLGESCFRIEESLQEGPNTCRITPDLATCSKCLEELFDPDDRRYRYPFLNCTQCGPRFSILEKLPYDRPNTSMSVFEMCSECQREYEDPCDRRFHAQPNACSVCGPALSLPLNLAVETLENGGLVALKGLGGFHLLADATNRGAVARLREVKNRPNKPLAIMVRNLEQARRFCLLDPLESTVLCSPEAPILLARRRMESLLGVEVAPQAPHLGIMLAYTPLHHLLLHDLGRPIVVTSANYKDEPLPTDNPADGLADVILSHNRTIVRGVDDSIVWVVAQEVRLLRCGRGYAPMALDSSRDLTCLGTGGHQKNCPALNHQGQVFVGTHLGDLESLEAITNFSNRVEELGELYALRPEVTACDHHWDYGSTRWAENRNPVRVWHHHAHLASCLLDNQLDEVVLGCIWDGSGLGPDNTVWGGEFLVGDARSFRRVHHWTPFPLYGGEAAVLEPARVALALLEILGRESPLPLSRLERRNLLRVPSVMTSSTGRLFDALAAFLGLCGRVEFEGQAAMMVETLVDPDEKTSYRGDDWPVAFEQVLDDLSKGVGHSLICTRFHNWLAEVAVQVAKREGCPKVALSGGCFQNRYLTEVTRGRLRQEGFGVLLHRRVPPNDGGLGVGQVAVACA